MLKQKIQEDLKIAMKNKQELELSVLRMLNSAIKNAEIANKRQELKDPGIIKAIKQQIKQRKDSISQYKEGKRFDLVEKERKELKILENYMPEQMSETQIKKTVKKIITDSGLSDFGPVMGKAMAELKDRADGALVKKIVEQELK